MVRQIDSLNIANYNGLWTAHYRNPVTVSIKLVHETGFLEFFPAFNWYTEGDFGRYLYGSGTKSRFFEVNQRTENDVTLYSSKDYLSASAFRLEEFHGRAFT